MTRAIKPPGAAYSPILGWVECVSEKGNRWFQCRAHLAVVGDVWEIKNSSRPDADDVGCFLWNARTMDNSREDLKGPRGYAATLEAAKAIVETILHNTGTANIAAPKTAAESDRLKQIAIWHRDALDLGDLGFYERHGFNVAEIMPRTRAFLKALNA